MSKGQLPRWVDYGVLPALNLLAAFIISGLVVVVIGEDPFEAVKWLVWGALGYGEGIGYTLYYATNFIFTGLAVAVAFHAGLFNIGGEGQAYVGGLGIALVCLAMDRFVPWWVTFPFAIIGGAVFGAAWAFIPGYLQAKRGSHIVITTIMFNFIASALMVYLLSNILIPQGTMSPSSRNFEAGGQLPLLRNVFTSFDFGQSPVNLAFFLALAVCVVVWLLIWHTKLGYEIRSFGANPDAAAYAGISPVRITVVTMLISGALAGLMGINVVMGEQTRLLLDFAGGAGFVGIAVALMGRGHPIGIILASMLFGLLYQGGAELAFEIPTISRDMIVVIQALVILFAGALEHMFRPAVVAFFDRFSSDTAEA
ncbi:ABC transporter permease [Pseudovibrio ascidiaceicola]|jgi:simple sugar transport system permease protein|uniref:Nucleoside ABC transporter membrane protein n=1 Tax=Pseudovibrio ascidiaceicola TaxID=285279 RepID=A0A1I3YVN6_9HYPH|nr:ABC transporter permease [Pseudovibrio ascidiaceicola]SFK35947.1 nucleoside ABC transporter membrane protein [Pseudovibrio ascidiaceicola]